MCPILLCNLGNVSLKTSGVIVAVCLTYRSTTFGMAIDHENSNKLCRKYFLIFRNYRIFHLAECLKKVQEN